MGSYSVNMLNQASWLVYINGIEIPVCGLTVDYGVWQTPTLSLKMVPHTILTRIGAEDRLQVAVFYLDHHWNPGNPEFCLLGEFEVVGWSYQNTPSGRYINLSCVSQLQILEQLHFYLSYKEQEWAKDEEFSHGEPLKVLRPFHLHAYPDALNT